MNTKRKLHFYKFVQLCHKHTLIPSQVAYDISATLGGTEYAYESMSIKDIEEFILNNY